MRVWNNQNEDAPPRYFFWDSSIQKHIKDVVQGWRAVGYFCTKDRGRNVGSKSIFYPDNVAKLKSEFGIIVLRTRRTFAVFDGLSVALQMNLDERFARRVEGSIGAKMKRLFRRHPHNSMVFYQCRYDFRPFFDQIRT